jgi:ankyrin repeat protein
MKIHQYAQQGNIAGVQQELALGVEIDLPQSEDATLAPQTPLQCALASAIAGLDMVQFLIAQGATLSLTGRSDLHWAISSGKLEKVQFLLDRGAEIGYVDSNGYDALLDAVFSESQGTEKLTLIKSVIENGAGLQGRSSYGESALSVASRGGWFEIIRLLLDAGCDRALLGWTDLMHAIALGTLADVEAQLKQGADLTSVDDWERTPWLLSLQVGDLDKAEYLLNEGSNPRATGRCGKLPLMYAIESGNLALLNGLIHRGFDVNATDDFEETALMVAADFDQVEAASILIDAGAIVNQATKHNTKAIHKARSLEMIERLLEAGEEMAEIGSYWRRQFAKVDYPDVWDLPHQDYETDKHPRFGTHNPSEMAIPFWREMVKFRGGAYAARTYYQDTDWTQEGAVWCFDRFGQSITRLPDGRVIEIAGEHEDSYDPDFHIYNDAVVYDGQGDFQIYGYPRTIFPPTDFHTATWVDGWIYIIGSLGYLSDRTIGQTPVYRLNCTTFAIEPVETNGEAPGWISKHRAVLSDRQIQISGGSIWTLQQDKPKLIEQNATYVLDLEQQCWHRVEAEL